MRHGETALNEGSDPKIRAWKDVPLSDAGRLDAQITANKLKAYKPGAIVSSDLMRDTETSHIVAKALGLHSEQDFRARTWDMGQFEGESLKDVNPAIKVLYQQPWKTPPGSSESCNGFSERWMNFLDDRMEMAASVEQWRPMIIVCHGKNIAMSDAYIRMIPAWEAIMPKPAGFAIINVEQDRSLGIKMIGPMENVIEDV